MIIVFGGEINYNNKLKRRECVNETYAFHLEKLSWWIVSVRGDLVEGRRSHTAVLLGS
jgi:hypothetical protein